jgi:hypothetical protein
LDGHIYQAEMSALDLDLLDTPAIRDILKTRAHLLRAGIPPDFVAVETLTIIIDHYKGRVGLTTYLSQMLGEMANVPVSDCALYWMTGERIATPVSEQPVQRFIKRKFRADTLPFKVVANEEVRFL